jgi:methyl-accepting chemotaxis protein
MAELTSEKIRSEIEKAYRLADESFAEDLREAALVKPTSTSDRRMKAIRDNYNNLRDLFTASQTAELKRIAAPVQKAFDEAVEARSAIENATAAEKDLVSRIKKFSALASAANDLYKEAEKAAAKNKDK